MKQERLITQWFLLSTLLFVIFPLIVILQEKLRITDALYL